jgi:hypothetical protein
MVTEPWTVGIDEGEGGSVELDGQHYISVEGALLVSLRRICEDLCANHSRTPGSVRQSFGLTAQISSQSIFLRPTASRGPPPCWLPRL